MFSNTLSFLSVPRSNNRNICRPSGVYELSDFVVEEHVKQGQMLASLGHFILRTPCSRIPLEKLIVEE